MHAAQNVMNTTDFRCVDTMISVNSSTGTGDEVWDHLHKFLWLVFPRKSRNMNSQKQLILP